MDQRESGGPRRARAARQPPRALRSAGVARVRGRAAAGGMARRAVGRRRRDVRGSDRRRARPDARCLVARAPRAGVPDDRQARRADTPPRGDQEDRETPAGRVAALWAEEAEDLSCPPARLPVPLSSSSRTTPPRPRRCRSGRSARRASAPPIGMLRIVACVSVLICASHSADAAPGRDHEAGPAFHHLLELVVVADALRVLVAERDGARRAGCAGSRRAARARGRRGRPSARRASRACRGARPAPPTSRCPSGRSRGAAARRAAPTRRTSSPDARRARRASRGCRPRRARCWISCARGSTVSRQLSRPIGTITT